ncbi:hypothetical protein [Nocardioides sp.]|uniref:hypothetical protein n=1 Tax=Nocardioides sp. TaxID=35761 RepID=UPI001A278B91|nr:hypothetical protein [Nocardioides sp.]MBJ7357363.1 hypothetical protein [Nocardioides sp.]
MNRQLPAQSILVALLAVSLASGGAGYAVAKLPANSVVSSTIKNGAVKTVDLRDGAVTSAKVADGSLTGADLGDGALSGAQIQDGGVTSADVQDDALTGADIDESTLAVPGKAGVLILTGRDFVPRTSTIAYSTWTGGDRFLETTTDWVQGQVDVPAGTTVTGAQVFVIDGGTDFIDAMLTRHRADGTVGVPLTEAQSVGSSVDVQTLTLAGTVAVTGTDRLVVDVLLPPSPTYRLLGVRITYTT